MDQVELSTNEFKALSSTTRTNLLKMLNERNYTLSELSTKTGMAAPTVKQHAAVLMGAGLIELQDEGRKWKYYSLTRKGKKIIKSKEQHTNILIILSSTIIVALLGVAILSTLNMPLMDTSTNDSYERAEILPGTNTDNTPQISGENKESGTPALEDAVKQINCTAVENKERLEEECSKINDEISCLEADLDSEEGKDCQWN